MALLLLDILLRKEGTKATMACSRNTSDRSRSWPAPHLNLLPGMMVRECPVPGEGDEDERMRSPSLPQESDSERNDQGSHSGQVTEAEHLSTPDVSRGPGALWDGSPVASPLADSFRGAQPSNDEDEDMDDQ